MNSFSLPPHHLSPPFLLAFRLYFYLTSLFHSHYLRRLPLSSSSLPASASLPPSLPLTPSPLSHFQVGFTDMSSRMDPAKVSGLLNRLFAKVWVRVCACNVVGLPQSGLYLSGASIVYYLHIAGGVCIRATVPVCLCVCVCSHCPGSAPHYPSLVVSLFLTLFLSPVRSSTSWRRSTGCRRSTSSATLTSPPPT